MIAYACPAARSCVGSDGPGGREASTHAWVGEEGAENLGNFEPLVSVPRARFQGENPVTDHLDTERVYHDIRRLAPLAELVHVKAFDPWENGSPLLDVDRALRVVIDAGFSGPNSIEWDGHLTDPWDATGQLLERIRAQSSR